MEERLLSQCITRRDQEGALKIIHSGVFDKRAKPADTYGYYLYLAAQMNDTNTMSALFGKGADPNFKLKDVGRDIWDILEIGNTPLHAAAERRRLDALRMLLKHGAKLDQRNVSTLTPFDVSVKVIEAPGPATDMLIEAGSKLRDDGTDKTACAGTHWAMASYAERHGDKSVAINYYKKAADWYHKASKAEFTSARFQKFRNSFLVGAALAGIAAGEDYFEVFPVVEASKENIVAIEDKGRRCVAYSKLCSDRARALAASPVGE